MPGVVSTYSTRPEPVSPALVDCSLYARIGMLSQDRIDKWWTLEEGQSPQVDQETGREVQSAIQRLVEPFLKEFDSREKVAASLMASPQHLKHVNPQSAAVRHAYAAIIYDSLGDQQSRHAAINKAVDLSRRSPVADHIAQLRERLG